MTDLREEIPQRAFINAEIIQMAVETSAFTNCVELIRGKYDLQEYEFMNPAYIVSLLYCLLVVPREIWLKSGPDHLIYDEVEKSMALEYFTIEIPDNRNDRFFDDLAYSFLRSLRNSVAHARFSVDQDMGFCFWDQRGEAALPHFKVSISVNDLIKFLSEVGATLANIRSL